MTHNYFCVKTNSIRCTCDREDYIGVLESELAAAHATVGILKIELNAAKAEIVRLSGKTNFCASCESYARVNEKLLDTIQRNEDKSVDNKRLRGALEKELRDMADKIEHSVNIKNIGEPSVSIINCHIQSRYDAKLCRDRADEIAESALSSQLLKNEKLVNISSKALDVGENKRLREALEKIAKGHWVNGFLEGQSFIWIAQDALSVDSKPSTINLDGGKP